MTTYWLLGKEDRPPPDVPQPLGTDLSPRGSTEVLDKVRFSNRGNVYSTHILYFQPVFDLIQDIPVTTGLG